jgi:hypothetical protein
MIPIRVKVTFFKQKTCQNFVTLDKTKEVFFLTFDQIHEVDVGFRLLTKLHGHFVDANDDFYTTK